MKRDKCSSYLPDSGTYGPCRDGHPQTAVCTGISADTVTPACCNEELCGLMYEPFGGKPPEHMLTPNFMIDT